MILYLWYLQNIFIAFHSHATSLQSTPTLCFTLLRSNKYTAYHQRAYTIPDIHRSCIEVIVLVGARVMLLSA